MRLLCVYRLRAPGLGLCGIRASVCEGVVVRCRRPWEILIAVNVITMKTRTTHKSKLWTNGPILNVPWD